MKRGDRVLVTGGAGFIGSHLSEALAAKHEVVVLDDLRNGSRENLEGIPKVRLVEASILDRAALEEAVQGCRAVFHLAALTSVPESVLDPARYSRVNTGGTATVLDAAVQAGARRFVLASTSAVYGDLDTPASEDAPPKPLSPYAASKAAAENLCQEFAASTKLTTVSLRLFNVYGPRQRADSAYASVIPAFVTALLAGRRPVLYGDGDQTRDFLHVRDAARFFLAAADAAASRVSGKVYNAASGKSVSINHLLALAKRTTGSSLEASRVQPREGDVRRSAANVQRARRDLKVRAEVPLETGLRELVAWYRGRAR